jgi:molybdopterin/thiamine biosynthesis adenylyltransferase
MPGLQHVGLVGLGNIGSSLAGFVARYAARLVLIDPGRIEIANIRNQIGYTKLDVGRFKVDAVAEQLERAGVRAKIETRPLNLCDIPWGEWLELNLVFAGLDSLEARRLLVSERAWPADIPVIDGGVAEQRLGGVKLILPGSENACLECSWSDAHYRQAAREYPCLPGADPAGPPTVSPAHLGAAVAVQMTIDWLNLCDGVFAGPCRQVDLAPHEHRVRVSRLRRSSTCRFDHARFESVRSLETSFEQARVEDVLAALERRYGREDVELTFRRGVILPEATGFRNGGSSSVRASSLRPHAQRLLADLGFQKRDGVRIRSQNEPRHALLLLAPLNRQKGGTL